MIRTKAAWLGGGRRPLEWTVRSPKTGFHMFDIFLPTSKYASSEEAKMMYFPLTLDPPSPTFFRQLLIMVHVMTFLLMNICTRTKKLCMIS